MDRERFEKLLADHLAGEISATDQCELMHFVDACPELRTELAAYEMQEELLTRYYKLKSERAASVGPEFLAEAFPEARPARKMWLRAAAVAAVIAVASLGISIRNIYLNQVPTGCAQLAQVSQLSGAALVLNGNAVQPLVAGGQIQQSQKIKIPRDGYLALTLADGNTIEARGGTQFTLEDLPDRLTVVLDGGQVWAHLKNKPLPKKFVVATSRLRAVATGTVYGVEDGLGGTIVAVAEGAINVERDGQQFSLSAGKAWDSRTNAETTLAAGSIDWSRMREDLVSLVQPVETPAPLVVQAARAVETGTQQAAQVDDLIDLLPAKTDMYIDLRNLSGLVGEFNTSRYSALWREEALTNWWTSIHGTELADSLTTQTHLREVMAVVKQLDGQCVVGIQSPDFIVVADCRSRADEASRLLGNALLEIAGNNIEAVQQMHERALVVDGRLVVSSSVALTRQIVSHITQRTPTGFAKSKFNEKVREAVGKSPRFVAAANIAPWMERWRAQDAALAQRLDFTGLSGLDNLIVSTGFAGAGMSQAARLGFVGERHGIVNWLAEPAPMRGFNFFSGDVHLFYSVVIRSPRTMFFDWLQYLISQRSEAEQTKAREFFNNHSALFDSVGNEMAAGLDNPILPVPNVKIVLELSKPAEFGKELDLLINDWVIQMSADVPKAERETTTYQNFTINTLRVDGWYVEPSWAIVDDYLVAGPGVAFVKDSIDVWRSGGSIAHNPKLLKLLPASSNVSLLVYQDVAKAIPELIKTKLAAGMSAEQRKMIPDLSFMERFSAAGIAYAVAHKEAIDFYFNTPEGIDFNLGMAAPLVANWLVPRMGIGERIECYSAASVAVEDLAKAALAFQAKNGKLPASMNDLVQGGFIAEAPADPCSKGATLKLIAGPTEGSIIVYSVGPDGVDDQGVLAADPASSKPEGDIAIVLPTLDGGPPKVATPTAATAATQTPAQ